MAVATVLGFERRDDCPPDEPPLRCGAAGFGGESDGPEQSNGRTYAAHGEALQNRKDGVNTFESRA
jgi:hypothetical protein